MQRVCQLQSAVLDRQPIQPFCQLQDAVLGEQLQLEMQTTAHCLVDIALAHTKDSQCARERHVMLASQM